MPSARLLAPDRPRGHDPVPARVGTREPAGKAVRDPSSRSKPAAADGAGGSLRGGYLRRSSGSATINTGAKRLTFSRLQLRQLHSGNETPVCRQRRRLARAPICVSAMGGPLRLDVVRAIPPRPRVASALPEAALGKTLRPQPAYRGPFRPKAGPQTLARSRL